MRLPVVKISYNVNISGRRVKKLERRLEGRPMDTCGHNNGEISADSGDTRQPEAASRRLQTLDKAAVIGEWQVRGAQVRQAKSDARARQALRLEKGQP
jgi:hypothetical protein